MQTITKKQSIIRYLIKYTIIGIVVFTLGDFIFPPYFPALLDIGFVIFLFINTYRKFEGKIKWQLAAFVLVIVVSVCSISLAHVLCGLALAVNACERALLEKTIGVSLVSSWNMAFFLLLWSFSIWLNKKMTAYYNSKISDNHVDKIVEIREPIDVIDQKQKIVRYLAKNVIIGVIVFTIGNFFFPPISPFIMGGFFSLIFSADIYQKFGGKIKWSVISFLVVVLISALSTLVIYIPCQFGLGAGVCRLSLLDQIVVINFAFPEFCAIIYWIIIGIGQMEKIAAEKIKLNL